ncbi:MAG: hypothetical protein U0X20_29955 [Caldilineaceae bacterium]
MLITFLIIFATIVLFVWNRLRPDLVALLSLLALFVTGVLSSQQALAGFSDSTTVMVAALFVVGEGLIARMRSENENFAVVGAPEAMATQVVKPNLKTWMSVLILFAMVVLMLTKLVPTVMAVLLRCVSPDDAYRSIPAADAACECLPGADDLAALLSGRCNAL